MPYALTILSGTAALKDVNFGSFLLLVLRRIAFLAHGLAAHLDAVGLVNQVAENRANTRRRVLLALPQTRIDPDGSSNRLRNAGLCHFFLHLAEGGGAECDLLVFCRHNTIIMSHAARQERSIQTK